MNIEIQNKSGLLKLNSGVNKESADKLIDDLDRLYGKAAVLAQMSIGDIVCSADDALESVEVEINSPGGSVFEGQRIFNALRSMSARGVEITTRVNGLAASMGSVILMAGDKREITTGSRVMIHEASTIAAGDARALRRQSDLLEGISAEIAGIYADRTGGDVKAIRQMMLAETWMDATEAKENGFVDSIIKDGKEFDTTNKGMTGILAKLFPGNDEAAKIEAAIVENDSLRADLDAANKQIAELQNLAEANATLQNDLTIAQTAIAELQDKVEQSNAAAAELEQAAVATEQKVAEKASELLASTGHPEPIAVVEAATEVSLREQYGKLTTPTERAAFRKAHWNNLLTQ